MEGTKMYLCDPEKNEDCAKRICGYYGLGKCFSTRIREHAKIGEDGEPVEWPVKIGQFLDDLDRLHRTIGELERMREVGVVNAKHDLAVLEDALAWLKLLQEML